MRKVSGIFLAAFAVLLMASASYASDRPHEGIVVSVQIVEKSAGAAGEAVTETSGRSTGTTRPSSSTTSLPPI
jgi:hypothetical protein